LKAGDIRLPDGSVVRAGAERRFYETAQHLRIVSEKQARAIDGLNTENTQLKAQVEAYKSAAAADTQLGLTPDESLAARQMVSKYKTDPIGTLRFLLAETAAAGHNLSDIVPGLDGLAMQRMLDAKLQPLVGQSQNRSTERDQIVSVQAHVEQFYNKFPDARQHDDALGKVVTALKCSPEEAYFALRNEVQKKGLDWYQPLEPQITALRARDAAAQGASQKVVVPQPPSLPSGRPGIGANLTDTPNVAHESTDWDDIIRSGMRDAGLSQ
jgi:hypothetical protein